MTSRVLEAPMPTPGLKAKVTVSPAPPLRETDVGDTPVPLWPTSVANVP
jgi:hypothetical protein